ncbi:hypothetical protein B0T17DRAFT_299358 [Bombardia bombarda]|uniref:Uncharacterized protein n=1 Tax=Bombardia bombarda TaxID=252184 RepID=A0AA40C1A0_9PEZI|nr:hypothetical protein B0T17DRAFT_299358 [Bombardia bombarda]
MDGFSLELSEQDLKEKKKRKSEESQQKFQCVSGLIKRPARIWDNSWGNGGAAGCPHTVSVSGSRSCMYDMYGWRWKTGGNGQILFLLPSHARASSPLRFWGPPGQLSSSGPQIRRGCGPDWRRRIGVEHPDWNPTSVGSPPARLKPLLPLKKDASGWKERPGTRLRWTRSDGPFPMIDNLVLPTLGSLGGPRGVGILVVQCPHPPTPFDDEPAQKTRTTH